MLLSSFLSADAFSLYPSLTVDDDDERPDLLVTSTHTHSVNHVLARHTHVRPFLSLSLCFFSSSLSSLRPCIVCRFNKYLAVAARATRQALKEEQRVAAERRGVISLRWQQWKDGKGGEQVRSFSPLLWLL